jgi:hypothetical protein
MGEAVAAVTVAAALAMAAAVAVHQRRSMVR